MPPMSLLGEDLCLKGSDQRKATLGDEYVEKNLAAAAEFTKPFQEAMTAWCRGTSGPLSGGQHGK